MHGNLRRRHHEADPWLPSALGGEELQRDEPARLPRGHVGDASLQHGGVSHLDGVDPVDQVHQDMRRWQEGQDEVSALSVVFFGMVFFRVLCMLLSYVIWPQYTYSPINHTDSSWIVLWLCLFINCKSMPSEVHHVISCLKPVWFVVVNILMILCRRRIFGFLFECPYNNFALLQCNMYPFTSDFYHLGKYARETYQSSKVGFMPLDGIYLGMAPISSRRQVVP